LLHETPPLIDIGHEYAEVGSGPGRAFAEPVAHLEEQPATFPAEHRETFFGAFDGEPERRVKGECDFEIANKEFEAELVFGRCVRHGPQFSAGTMPGGC